MNQAGESIAGTSVMHIEGDMTIYQAADLKARLESLLRQSGPLEIDLSAVTEIDTTGVQLLMLAKRCAGAAQKELRLARHSQPVLDAFELLDLAGWFGDPLVMAS
jgi:anti-anti-sigma factor